MSNLSLECELLQMLSFQACQCYATKLLQSEAAGVTGGNEPEEGSPRGEGNQFPDEDQGYNPLVPGRVIYIYR